MARELHFRLRRRGPSSLVAAAEAVRAGSTQLPQGRHTGRSTASRGTARTLACGAGSDAAAICASALVTSAAAPRVRAAGFARRQRFSATVPQSSLAEGAEAGRDCRHKLERLRCAGAWACRPRLRQRCQRSSTRARDRCLGGASLDTARRTFLGAARAAPLRSGTYGCGAAGSEDSRRNSKMPAQDRAKASTWSVRRFPCGCSVEL
jgi:hypothetical protein